MRRERSIAKKAGEHVLMSYKANLESKSSARRVLFAGNSVSRREEMCAFTPLITRRLRTYANDTQDMIMNT